MKKFLMMGALALSLFCSCLAQEQPGGAVAEEPAQIDARILLSTEKVTYFGGEEVVLGITFENMGKTPLYFHYEDVDAFYTIEVTAFDRTVKPLSGFKSQRRVGFFSQGITIPPQGKKKGYFYLSRAFDVSQMDMYTVRVSKEIVQGGHIYTVTSRPLDFGVIEPSRYGWWETDTAPTAPKPNTTPAKHP